MGKKNREKQVTIEVSLYDDEVGDYYQKEVPKVAVSNCALCGCAGCLSDKCCEHLQYWSPEHGQPARYQVRSLSDHIHQLEILISKLEQNRKDSAAAIESVVSKVKKTEYQSPEMSLLRVLQSSLEKDIQRFGRTFCPVDEYLCRACNCQKCNARMMQSLKNTQDRSQFQPAPECCGHKDYTPDELPF